MEQDVDFEDVYELDKEIGMGSYSFVHLAIHRKTRKQFAVKIIDKSLLSAKERARLITEVENQKSCKHPHIVSITETFDTKHRLYMVMDIMLGGDLFERLVSGKNYSEEETRILIRNIALAVSYMHERGLVHRDLKPENMLLPSKIDHTNVKLADFGFSKRMEDGALLTTPCGSPGYVAPEIAKEQSYDTGVDMWSIGVIMYTLLSGTPPFYSEDDDRLLELVATGRYKFPEKYWKSVSKDAIHLVTHLLEVNTAKRFTAKQVLNHPWIRESHAEEAPVPLCSENIDVKEVELSPEIPSDNRDLQQMRKILNSCIDVKRDGAVLRSATESSIFNRRRKKKQACTQQSITPPESPQRRDTQ